MTSGAVSSYSVRSALIGEIAAARPAGMMAAKNAHAASDPAATVSAKGSQNGVQYVSVMAGWGGIAGQLNLPIWGKSSRATGACSP